MNKHISIKKIIVIWILIYVFIIFFSILISSALIEQKNKNLIRISYHDRAYYQEHGTFNPNATKNYTNNYFYDGNLNRIAYLEARNANTTFDFDAYAHKLYERTYKKGMLYNIIFSYKLENHVAIAILLPYGNDGLFIFLKELPLIKNIYLVLLPSITLLSIICAIFTIYIVRKNQAFEKMQKEYVDNISHELKSPIASVQALTTAIYDGMVTDENMQKNYCCIMLSELQRLQKTVSDMLELSKIQNNQINCVKNPCLGFNVFEAILKKRSILCQELNIQFCCFPPLEEYPVLFTNQMLASRMLDIIVDNAIKFTPIGGTVTLTMTQEKHKIIMTVMDSGPGISLDDLPHIFDRFYKSDKSHNEYGSGLGLSIAKEIADCLSERIWIENTSTQGTSCSFTISTFKN